MDKGIEEKIETIFQKFVLPKWVVDKDCIKPPIELPPDYKQAVQALTKLVEGEIRGYIEFKLKNAWEKNNKLSTGTFQKQFPTLESFRWWFMNGEPI